VLSIKKHVTLRSCRDLDGSSASYRSSRLHAHSPAQYTAGRPKKLFAEHLLCILLVFCTLRRPHLGILRHILEISPMSSQLERTILTPLLTRLSPILQVNLCKIMRSIATDKTRNRLLQMCFVFLHVQAYTYAYADAYDHQLQRPTS